MEFPAPKEPWIYAESSNASLGYNYKSLNQVCSLQSFATSMKITAKHYLTRFFRLNRRMHNKSVTAEASS
jgi:phosphatidylserine/phosphatidylglycerophosphate/cardiolipin synthase-like enzyme